MPEENRPNPDVILSAIQRQERRATCGQLRVFFGMAAGVGKTFAMLKAAQARLNEGMDIVVALVETHGRAETNQILGGLEIIPRRLIAYKGTEIEEMDLDAVLARKPKLALVDELAHSNAPGSRHSKRWQDVIELLDAGIDVYTTLNVQHVESRKELVEQITGITMRETVPDTLLQRASQIVLVDLAPVELLQRLREGKVYLGERAEVAAQNFFKEDRLTALREIALRLTAEAVESELHNMAAIGGRSDLWKTTERLMVAVSHSPHSEDLIRSTRRLAFSMNAQWIAVYVDAGKSLAEGDRKQLAKNLSLATELGAEVISIVEVDVPKGLLRVAQRQNITQLVVGQPTPRRFRDWLTRGTTIDRLALHASNFDIHVLRPLSSERKKSRELSILRFESSLVSYWYMLWVTIVTALLSLALVPTIGYRAVGFVFLLSVLGVGLFVSIGPTVFAAFLAALTWNYFFIPPTRAFVITEPEDVAMCIALFVTASVTGILTSRTRQREKLLRSREERTESLYQVAKSISAAKDRLGVTAAASGSLASRLDGEVSVALKKVDGQLEHVHTGNAASWMRTEKEWTVATWAFEHGKVAGWSTSTLASSEALYIPLIGPAETVGVLAFRPASSRSKSQDEDDLLMAVARLLAVAAERELLQERSRVAEQLAESERLYQTIFNSVSHELRTPLTGIVGNASALLDDNIASTPESRRLLAGAIWENSQRLSQVVSNLLDMSRLESGVLQLRREWHDVIDLIGVTLSTLSEQLRHRKVGTVIDEHLPLIRIDFSLMQQSLTNLLLNAAAYSPGDTEIEIVVRRVESELAIEVLDSGPGLPENVLPHLFDKFYRVPGAPPGGTGIGLAITKSIVEAHGGRVLARNRVGGGSSFLILLPVEEQPDVSQEPVSS